MIKLRTANRKDLPQLLHFEQGVIIAERPFDPFIKESDINYYDIQNLIDSGDSEMVVAEIDGQMVGCGYAQIRKSKPYWKESQYVYLGFMFVHPDYRGQGINQMILDHLKEWAKSKNIFELRLDVYVENESAIRAYQKAGFKEHMLEMRLNLAE
jgi:ribosomal protein S18 acetylase RimI-like enzyme